MTDEALARIAGMEASLDACTAQTAALRDQLSALGRLREQTRALFDYYGSEAWHTDREAELPEGTKAGVLSEDSVYDAITELREAAFAMLELGTEVLRDWL